MPYTPMDEALERIKRRRDRVGGFRAIALIIAVLSILGSAGMATTQLQRIDQLNIEIQTLGELTSVMYLYILAITWAIGGIANFVFFGFFALHWGNEAATLRAVMEIEHARRKLD